MSPSLSILAQGDRFYLGSTSIGVACDSSTALVLGLVGSGTGVDSDGASTLADAVGASAGIGFSAGSVAGASSELPSFDPGSAPAGGPCTAMVLPLTASVMTSGSGDLGLGALITSSVS
jgi:hypothetical protein